MENLQWQQVTSNYPVPNPQRDMILSSVNSGLLVVYGGFDETDKGYWRSPMPVPAVWVYNGKVLFD